MCCRFCGFQTYSGAIPDLAESIILSHWGLTTPEIPCGWWQRLHSFGHCPERDHPEQLMAPLQMPCFVSGKVGLLSRFDIIRHLDFRCLVSGKPRTADVGSAAGTGADRELSFGKLLYTALLSSTPGPFWVLLLPS